jgi:hypothetical protein
MENGATPFIVTRIDAGEFARDTHTLFAGKFHAD